MIKIYQWKFQNQAKVLVSVLYFSCFGNLEHEITRGIGAESLGRHSDAFPSFEKPRMTPVNETSEQGVELQDQAMVLDLRNSETEPAEDEAEHPASRGKGAAQHCC